MAHHEKLSSTAELGEKPEEPRQVHVVEGGLDFVHDVEGRRSAAEDGEEKCKCRERAFATGEKRKLLHVLAAGLGFDFDAGVEEILGRGQGQLARPAGEEHPEEILEVRGHVGERLAEDALDLVVDRLDHAEQFTTRAAHVLQLRLEELVTLLQFAELLEGQRIDGSHEAQFALEIPHPGDGRDALGNLRSLGGLGHFRFDVEIPPQRLDRCLETHPHLCLVDVDPTSALALLVELAFGVDAFATGVVESLRDGTHLVALLAALFVKLHEKRLRHLAMAVDELAEAHDGHERLLHPFALLGHLGTGLDVGSESCLGLGEAALDELLSFAQADGLDLEILATQREVGGFLLDAGPRGSDGPHGLGLHGLVGFESRQDRFQLGEARGGPLAACGNVVALRLHGVELGHHFAALGGDARQRVGSRQTRTGQLIVLALEFCERFTGRLHLGPCTGEFARAALELCICSSCALRGVFEGRRRDGTALGAEPPARCPEPVAAAGDHVEARMIESDTHRLAPRVGNHRTREQGVEQRVDRGGTVAAGGADAVTDAAHARRQRHRRRSRVAEREDRTVHVLRIEAPKGLAGRLGVAHHDACDGITERGVDCFFPAVVDDDEIDEGPDDAGDFLEMLDAGATAGNFQRLAENVDAGLPVSQLRRCRRVVLRRGIERGLGGDAPVGLDPYVVFDPRCGSFGGFVLVAEPLDVGGETQGSVL